MKDYSVYADDKTTNDKERATFADGFLAAMMVYDLPCPVEDDPNSVEAQSWVLAKVLGKQVAIERELHESRALLRRLRATTDMMAVEMASDTNGAVDTGVTRIPMAHYGVPKYDLIAMLLDCKAVNEHGVEIDDSSHMVAPGKHQPWPLFLYQHKKTGKTISPDRYAQLSEEVQAEFEALRYVKGVGPDGKELTICEDDYRILELVEWLINIGDPINETLRVDANLILRLKERFDYDLPARITAFNQQMEKVAY